MRVYDPSERYSIWGLAQHKKQRNRFPSTPRFLNSAPKGLFTNQQPSYFSFFATLLITEERRTEEKAFCCSCKPLHKMPPIGFPPNLLFHLKQSVLKDQLRQLDKGFGLWGIIGWLACNKLLSRSLHFFLLFSLFIPLFLIINFFNQVRNTLADTAR